jgi:hypothetical protein
MPLTVKNIQLFIRRFLDSLMQGKLVGQDMVADIDITGDSFPIDMVAVATLTMGEVNWVFYGVKV